MVASGHAEKASIAAAEQPPLRLPISSPLLFCIYRCWLFVSSCSTPDVLHLARSYLGETNIGRLLPEALTADVQAVLADETSSVCADAAVTVLVYPLPPCHNLCHSAALDIPLTGAFAVGAWARVPDALVRHDCG